MTAGEVIERSPLIRELVEAGHLRSLRGIYDLDGGHVRWLDDDQARAEAPLPPASRVLAGAGGP